MTDMNTELLKIIEHYGVNHQIRKLNEEQYELCEALYDRFKHSEDEYSCKDEFEEEGWRYEANALNRHIEEEIADNLVLIRQFIAKYELNNMRIEDIVRQKTKRQLQRMEKGE